VRAVGHRHVNIEEGAASARNEGHSWRPHRRPLYDAADVTASTAEIRPSAYVVIHRRAPASAPPARERDAQIKAWNTFPQSIPVYRGGSSASE